MLGELNFSEKYIYDKEIQYIANALENNQVITSFMEFFLYRTFFSSTKTVTELHLYNNLIKADGAKYLSHALKNNTVFFF